MFAGLVGGIGWNLLTWLLDIPSSSSHALIGGIVGAMIAAFGGHGVIWHGLVSKVILPALLAPTFAHPVSGWFNYAVAIKILVFGLVVGAGLPTPLRWVCTSTPKGPR